MTSELGPLVRQLRRKAGMTQDQLQEKSGVSVRTIRRLESGTEKNFRLDTVRLLATALDPTADERRELMSAAGVLSEEPERGGRTPFVEVTDRLADVLRGRWEREVEARGAHKPFALPVRFEPVPDDLADHWDNICRVPPGETAEPLDLTGDLHEIVEVYRRVPSGRLVVLGRAGSGKTILTLRFVLDYLARRTSADPVPVIVSLGAWDPTAATLRDWLIARLLRDHPDLVAGAPGGTTLAAALVDAGRILPVLDGFDEIPEGLYRAALRALNGTSLPMVLTSRPHEYRKALAATDVLTWAAGIWIEDLTPADMADFLRRSSRTTRWDSLLADLREHPDRPACKNLIAVLSTPLMVDLARTIYNDTEGDPKVLLDTTRFPTEDDLEDHLLSSFVPTVYRPHSAGVQRPDWTVDRIQRWLGHLARHLDRLDTPDLAWWQLGNSFSRSSRILAVIVASAIVTALADWLVIGPQYVMISGLATGLLDGLLLGSVVGLSFGLIYGVMIVYGGVVFEPSRVQLRLFDRNSGTPVVRTFSVRFGIGFLGGFAVGLGYEPIAAVLIGLSGGFPIDALIRTALINTLVFGLIFGLAAGVVFGLASVLEAPADLDSATSPRTMLRADRATVVRRALVLGPVFALAIAFGGMLVVVLLQGPLGPLEWPLLYGLNAGAVGGLTGALSYTFAFTAWGQWLVFARVWLPLTGKLPWAVTAFLDDAYTRGVLRQSGAVYQFRHARLQDHLSRAARHAEQRG